METCNLSPHAAENLIRKMDDLESRIAKLELNEQKSKEKTINNQIYPHKRRSKSHYFKSPNYVRKSFKNILLSFLHSIFMMQTWLIEERSSKVFLRRAFPQLQLEERHHQQWLLLQHCLHHVVLPFLILRLDSPGTKIPTNISFFTVHKEKARAQNYDIHTTLKNHPTFANHKKNIWIYKPMKILG